MPDENLATSESSTDNKNDQSYLADHQGAKAPESPTGEDANTQDSSTAKPGEEKSGEPKSPLEVVQSAMKSNTDEGSPSSKPGETTDTSKAEGETDADKEAKEIAVAAEKLAAENADKEAGKDVPFHDHPRWKEVFGENRTLKALVAEYETGEVKERADNFQQLNNFLSENNLDSDELKEGLRVMSAMKNNPEEALQIISQYYDVLRKMNGYVLPDDIQAKLDDGTIDKDTAYAMSTDRARNGQLQARLDKQEQTDQTRQKSEQENDQRNKQATFVEGMKNAVTDWETKWGEKDPDYSKLMPLVRDRVATLKQMNPPKTAEDAVKLAEQAKTEIQAEMAQFVPKIQPIENISSHGTNTSNQQVAEPKSGLDVVKNSLAAGQ